MFGKGRWPAVRATLDLAGEKVRLLMCLKKGMWDTVFFYRLCIVDSVSFFGYLEIQQP